MLSRPMILGRRGEREWSQSALGAVLKVHRGYAFKGEYFVEDGPDVLLTPRNFHAEGGLDTDPERCKTYHGR